MTMVLIAGLLPVAILLYLIYSHDKIEKEPIGLLIKLLLLGCVSTIPAMILELVWRSLLKRGLQPLCFLVVMDCQIAFICDIKTKSQLY